MRNEHHHPIGHDLDAAAAAMPERFTQSIEQYETGWTAKAMSWDCTLNTGVIEADTELLARFRLAVACRQAIAAVDGEGKAT